MTDFSFFLLKTLVIFRIMDYNEKGALTLYFYEKVVNMDGYSEINAEKGQGFTVVYPKHEDAVTIALNETLPVKNILIGITYPFPSYKINRAPSKKYCLFEHVLEGKGQFFVNGKWQTITAGDTFIVLKSDAYQLYSDKNEPLKKIWIGFASEYVEKMLEGYNLQTGIYRANTKNHFQNLYDFSKINASPLSKYFKVAENLHAIITEIAQSRISAKDDPVSLIKNELLTLVYSRCSLDEIAEKLFMSKSNLIRIFKKQTAITPYQFLLGEKLKAAKALLNSTTMSIKSISDTLCFTDEHYFSFLFKQKVGVSPSDYREKSLMK